MEMSTFFFTTAGASATLMGLLFIALQFNLERRGNDIRWRPQAEATFNMYAMLFIVSLFLLIPHGQNINLEVLIFFIIPVAAIVRQVRIWLPTRKFPQKDRLIHNLWIMLIPVSLYSIMVWIVISMPGTDASQVGVMESTQAVFMVLLFIVALRNAWGLVFEAGTLGTST